MKRQIGRESIPWAMAAGRAVLGPGMVVGAACGWNPAAMAGMVVVALVSDIFDGVLARRWGCDTAAVRVFDSLADTVFYLGVAAALWVARPEVIRANRWLLGGLLGLEVVRFGWDLAKFGRVASYHSYLAKTWGLVMAIAVVGVFGLGRGNVLLPAALVLGIACNVEGLAMSVVLPLWQRDVKTLGAALGLRDAMVGRPTGSRPDRRRETLLVPRVLGLAAGLAVVCAVPAFAVEAGHAAYVGGSVAGVAEGTVGTLDATASDALVFRYATPGTPGRAAAQTLEIPYRSVTRFQYSTEVAHHIGVLPAIAVSLVKKRERRHFFTITYADASDRMEVAILEVAKHDPPVVLAVLRARAPQACGKAGLSACGGTSSPH